MDGPGSPRPDQNRSHFDDATNYSPSRSPPLAHSISGNESASGSPGGSRRYGSIGEKEKKNREERLKLMKERAEQQHEKRLAELKAAAEKEVKVRQMIEAERLRKIQEMRSREAQKRHAFEERRRVLEKEVQEKREQILAKYKEYEHKLNSHRDQKKPVYAFGSSTPRTLAYLEHLDNSLRVYNSRLASASDAVDATESPKTAAEKRATSACSLMRKPLTASSSPNLSPQHQHHRTSKQHHPPPTTSRTTKQTLPNSGRWGGSMVASMYGGSTALSTANAHAGGDPLADIESMTTSFAVGESSVSSFTKNVRTKGPLTNNVASARSQSTSRLARSSAPPRKARQTDTVDGPKSTVPKQQRTGSNGSGEGAANVAATVQKAKAVSSARTPSAPPPTVRRPVTGDAASAKTVVAPASSRPATAAGKEKTKPGVAPKTLPPKPPTGEPEAPKIIRKQKVVQPEAPTAAAASAAPQTPAVVNAEIRHELTDGLVPLIETSPEVVTSPQQLTLVDLATPDAAVLDVDSIHLVEDHLSEYQQPHPEPQPEPEQHEIESMENVIGDQEMSLDREINMTASVMETSMAELVPSVPKPTGQSVGKVLSKEEAAAALAERRRLAREQMEREKELERQREEQRLREEEEQRRKEEEEFRRQEAEELRYLEEAKRLEEERVRRMMEEEQKRRDEEEKQREEENRKKIEAEAKAREEAERVERERRDAEEKFRKEELERSERKKRLEAIMSRTRQTGASAQSTPISKPPSSQQPTPGGLNASFLNGGGHGNDISMYATPDTTMDATFLSASGHTPSATPTHSASELVLKKIAANARSEVGRSLENILNRVKSTPNVSDVERTMATNASQMPQALMTTSFSADKVGETPSNGDHGRMTQSFYSTSTHDDGGISFNYSGERTEYDLDASGTKSESHYARILSNHEVGNASFSPIPSVDSMNANQQPSAIRSNIFDHNDNVNGSAASSGTNGHERISASDTSSDASSAVTVIQQKMSPLDLSSEDPFNSSPTKANRAFDDLLNDNLSNTPDGQFDQITSASKITTTSSHQHERPLMDF